jgi:hypothetical protein
MTTGPREAFMFDLWARLLRTDPALLARQLILTAMSPDRRVATTTSTTTQPPTRHASRPPPTSPRSTCQRRRAAHSAARYRWADLDPALVAVARDLYPELPAAAVALSLRI